MGNDAIKKFTGSNSDVRKVAGFPLHVKRTNALGPDWFRLRFGHIYRYHFAIPLTTELQAYLNTWWGKEFPPGTEEIAHAKAAESLFPLTGPCFYKLWSKDGFLSSRPHQIVFYEVPGRERLIWRIEEG